MENPISWLTGTVLINALDMSVTVEFFFYRYRRVLLYFVLALDVSYLCAILIVLSA
jgi:hypothetical protein